MSRLKKPSADFIKKDSFLLGILILNEDGKVKGFKNLFQLRQQLRAAGYAGLFVDPLDMGLNGG